MAVGGLSIVVSHWYLQSYVPLTMQRPQTLEGTLDFYSEVWIKKSKTQAKGLNGIKWIYMKTLEQDELQALVYGIEMDKRTLEHKEFSLLWSLL